MLRRSFLKGLSLLPLLSIPAAAMVKDKLPESPFYIYRPRRISTYADNNSNWLVERNMARDQYGAARIRKKTFVVFVNSYEPRPAWMFADIVASLSYPSKNLVVYKNRFGPQDSIMISMFDKDVIDQPLGFDHRRLQYDLIEGKYISYDKGSY